MPHCAYEGLMTGPELLDHIDAVHLLPVPRTEPMLGTRLYTFIKQAKRGANAMDDDADDDVNDPAANLSNPNRPALASVSTNSRPHHPKRIGAADKQASKRIRGEQGKGKRKD